MYRVERPTMKMAVRGRHMTALLFLLALAALPAPARAQWAAPTPGSGDIINTNAGNVGVGTGTSSPPAGKLDVRGNVLVNGATRVIDAGEKFSLLGEPSFGSKAGYMTFTSADALTGADPPAGARVTAYLGVVSGNHPNPGGFLGTYTNHKFSLRTNNANRVTISSLGFVGVGTSDPLALFHVDGGTDLAGQMRLSGKGAVMSFIDNTAGGAGRRYQWRSEGQIFRMSLLNATDDNWVQPDILVANPSGYVGLGMNTPAYRLDSAGSVHAVGEKSAAFANQPLFTGGGQQHNFGGGAAFGPLGRGSAYNPTGIGTNPGAVFVGGGEGGPTGAEGAGGAAGLFTRGGDTRQDTWSHAWGGVGLFAEGGLNAPSSHGQTYSRYAAAAFFNGYVQIGSNDGRQAGLAVGFDGHNGYGARLPAGGGLIVSGSVGVGTPAPEYKLDVRGGRVNAESGLCIAGDCRDSWAQAAGGGQWSQNQGGGIYFNSANVGIGTQSPEVSLDVKTAAGAAVAARFQGNIAGSNNAQVRFAAGGADLWAVGNAVATNDATHNFDIFDLTASANRLRIDAGGNVGIGVTNPTHTLEVNGTIHAEGAITGATINATFQDVAEWVPSVQRLTAGTVVVLDSGRTNHVVASGKAYDTAVAGVVSDSPGVILGVGGEGRLKVATTGRVKVRVDATRGAIHVGDLLVTGGAEGVAMKSIPVDLGGVEMHRPGTIIGKALEPLEKGVGEILVLLSLQ